MTDPYEILGVPRNASDEDIKKALVSRKLRKTRRQNAENSYTLTNQLTLKQQTL